MTAPAPTTTEQKLLAEARVVAAKFATEYGAFTRTLVAHPKTTFFLGVGAALIAGDVIGHIF
jgi:hypothetical protein